MNRILNFVREKAFVLILLGSILAAAGTGIWAIRTVQQNLNQSSTPDELDLESFWETEQEGNTIWDEPVENVTDEMDGEIAMDDTTAPAQESEEAAVYEPGEPMPEDGQTGQDTPSESATSLPGELSSSDASDPSIVYEPQTEAVTPSFVMPVSGLVTQLYSEDELIYNETLGDWRTHNGIDYAASLGEEVIAPIAGEVTALYTDGNWGGVVELLDAQGYTWRFCGVENSTLQAGEHVEIGRVIGEIGIISAESAMDPHLHLEILHNGQYQDPADFLR